MSGWQAGKLEGVKSMRWFPVLAVLALLGFLVWVLFAPKGAGIPGGEPPGSPVPDGEMAEAGSEQEPGRDRAQEEPVIHSPDPVLRAELQSLQASLAAQPGRQETLRILQEFSARWLAFQPEATASAVLEFLQTGQDLPTGLDFVVGEGGLEEWPSLRTFLLELLGKMNPEMANLYALETVIPEKKSAAEYAVALQILWNHGGAEKATSELASAWLGLLQQPDWAARTDAAWLESLDFATRIPEVAPVFLETATAWLAQGSAARFKIGALPLLCERMMLSQPRETLDLLVARPDLLGQGQGPSLRAEIFARTDPRDPGQTADLEQYLARLTPGGRETEKFFRSFPMRNYGLAPALSGIPDVPEAAVLREQTQAALAWCETAILNPRLASHRQNLLNLRQRLSDLSLSR